MVNNERSPFDLSGQGQLTKWVINRDLYGISGTITAGLPR